MPDDRDHANYDALAVAWALDALDAADHDWFERHLASGCPRCAENIRGALTVAAELALALPQVPATPALRLRVVAVATESPAPSEQMFLPSKAPNPPERAGGIRATEPSSPGERRLVVKHLRVTVAAAAVMATAAACGGASSAAAPPAPSSAAGASAPASPASASTNSTSAATSAPSAPAVVTIKDFAFAVPAAVPAGATVQVKNDDGEAHTVTADSGGAFDTMVGGKATASFTAPTKPGRYPFHCTYHGNMHGVLVVT